MSGQAFAIHCRLRHSAPVIARPQQRRASVDTTAAHDARA